MIKASALIAAFKQMLDDQWGYIWGTAGVLWTAARQRDLEKTTDADRANSRKYGSQWIGHIVTDCSGAFKRAFSDMGGKICHGSHTMYLQYCSAKGNLTKGKRTDGQGLKPGTAVFTWKEDTQRYGHVGLYIGDGKVIEAYGAQKGVIMSKVTESRWTNWGELKGIDYSDAAPDQPADDPGPICPTIRKGSSGEFVIVLQEILVDLAYDIGPSGVDGKFGAKTEAAVKLFQAKHGLTADGIVGPRTWQQLLIYQGDEPDTYAITITGLNKEQAEKLQQAYPGSKITKED